jgi:integrase
VRVQKPNEIAFFTLAMFAGIRPEELEKITWKSVNLQSGFVTIDSAASKVRRRRIVHLEPNAIQWMHLAESCDSRLPIGRMTRRRYLDYAERWLGFEGWPQDCLRHTCASYLLAKPTATASGPSRHDPHRHPPLHLPPPWGSGGYS